MTLYTLVFSCLFAPFLVWSYVMSSVFRICCYWSTMDASALCRVSNEFKWKQPKQPNSQTEGDVWRKNVVIQSHRYYYCNAECIKMNVSTCMFECFTYRSIFCWFPLGFYLFFIFHSHSVFFCSFAFDAINILYAHINIHTTYKNHTCNISCFSNESRQIHEIK